MRRPAPLLAVVALVALLAGFVVPAPALAAGAAFADSKADPTWAEGIEFTVEVTSPTPLSRVELRLGYPDALGPVILDVPVRPQAGTQSLRYRLDLGAGGHLVPNTPISYTWAAFTEAGAAPSLSKPATVRYRDTSEKWKTLEGDLIRVHWYTGSERFAQRALEIGEQAVRDTSSLLGVTETRPIDFFIYGDEGAFREALGPGTRENVGGQAHADIRTLFALITPDAIDDPWVGVVVPHELVHLVFDTAVRNPYRFPPRWVNEGLAVYLSEGLGSADRNLLADNVSGRTLLPLSALGGQFPTDPVKTSLAYAESVSAIDYLVRAHGREAMLALVAAYKDGLTDDEAFTKATGEDFAAFQAGWLQDLGAAEPEQYGPQPAPPGPLPPGWSGAAPSSDPLSTPAPGAPTVTPDTPGAPGATPPAGEPPSAPADAASSVPVLLLGLGLVVAVVVGGLVVARRRDRQA